MQNGTGLYQHNIRSFVKGESGLIGAVASRIAGSSDLYEPSKRLPYNSINYNYLPRWFYS